MKRLITILLLSCFYLMKPMAQNVFTAGEQLTYEAAYNWGFLWIKAGKVTFTVSDTILNDENCFSFSSIGSSFKAYDWLFKVRDTFSSIAVKKDLNPISYHRKTYEGGFETNYSYRFDEVNRRVYCITQNSNRPQRYDTIEWKQNTFDLLTATYHTRNLPFLDIEVGDTVPVRVIIDRKDYNLYVRYLGRETIKNRDGEKYRCLKFSALLVSGTIFKGGEDLEVWVSDDDNRIPIMVKAKILVGSVKAYLTKWQGLKCPLSAIE